MNWAVGFLDTKVIGDTPSFSVGRKAEIDPHFVVGGAYPHKATTTELKELWAKVANESLERNGDEGRAIREANAVVARQAEVHH